MHDIVVEVNSNGVAHAVFHPTQGYPTPRGSALLAQGAGAGIEPTAPGLRRVFHWLRRRYGRAGRVAAWTRRWPCCWRVVLPGGHCTLGVFPTHSAAVNAEVRWLLRKI